MNFYERKDHLRSLVMRLVQLRLKNKDFSVIASTCNGGVLLHDLNQRFNSPFVNLWMWPKDYIRLLSNFEEYMKHELEFINDEDYDYPVAMLKDVKIYFQHYKSKEEAQKKWDERKARINMDNLFIMFTDRDGCTYSDLKEFDNLPYENKVVLTKKEYPELKSAVYIPGFEKEESVGICSEYRGKYSLKRYYDDFNYIKWINNGKKVEHNV